MPRPGIPVQIIDTEATNVKSAFQIFDSEADAAVAIFDNYDRRTYINTAVSARGIGTIPHTNGRYIARRLGAF